MDNDFFQYPFLALRDLNNRFILNVQGLCLYMNWNSTKRLLPGITLINSYLAFSFFSVLYGNVLRIGCNTQETYLFDRSCYLVISKFFAAIAAHCNKGRYTRGVLLPEHAPGSFCTCQYTRGSVFKFAQFAPGACSQIFNRLNIVEHFAGRKFCSRKWSIPMKSLVHTEELCYRSVRLEHAPGAKSLVCIGLNITTSSQKFN